MKQEGTAKEHTMPKGRASAVAGTADPVTHFFAALEKQGHLATFEGACATVRLDVVDGKKVERWHISITRGDVAVTHSGGPADATVRIDRGHLEALITGRMNAQAAFLRNLFACEGSVAALMMFQRCLPGPPGSTGRVKPLSSKAVMAERGMK
ncbi:MAG TPA: SCP2 sterol-binding domain-containing protein [Streptosporangiaceae bacterium]|nr:SCP2 sterol-binding domain-containing protein [Streptosporangiaceae bacterium]